MTFSPLLLLYIDICQNEDVSNPRPMWNVRSPKRSHTFSLKFHFGLSNASTNGLFINKFMLKKRFQVFILEYLHFRIFFILAISFYDTTFKLVQNLFLKDHTEQRNHVSVDY